MHTKVIETADATALLSVCDVVVAAVADEGGWYNMTSIQFVV